MHYPVKDPKCVLTVLGIYTYISLVGNVHGKHCISSVYPWRSYICPQHLTRKRQHNGALGSVGASQRQSPLLTRELRLPSVCEFGASEVEDAGL